MDEQLTMWKERLTRLRDTLQKLIEDSTNGPIPLDCEFARIGKAMLDRAVAAVNAGDIDGSVAIAETYIKSDVPDQLKESRIKIQGMREGIDACCNELGIERKPDDDDIYGTNLIDRDDEF